MVTGASWPPALLTPAQVPTFAVTDDKGKPYVAEVDGQNKGFFFLVQEKYIKYFTYLACARAHIHIHDVYMYVCMHACMHVYNVFFL